MNVGYQRSSFSSAYFASTYTHVTLNPFLLAWRHQTITWRVVCFIEDWWRFREMLISLIYIFLCKLFI